MKKLLNNCNPTIMGRSDLMSEDGIFVVNTKEQCATDCIHRNICARIIDLLSQKKI